MSPELSPPTKASLFKWWAQFKKKGPEHTKPPVEDEHPVFGKSLKESLKRASVQISTANANGELYVWGYIPVVVAKCGLHLKENATEVEGTFRVNGSTKRMRELQAAFEKPPRYGKDLNWKEVHYTTHDVATVFRRYLTRMPEPVVPHNMYHNFRDVLAMSTQSVQVIAAKYRELIQEMPRANQFLLLYVLDLLSVFAKRSNVNLMTAANLAVIFQPGVITHPTHELSPSEHQLSQRVLEFLIEHQDQFLHNIPPPPKPDPSHTWRYTRSHHPPPLINEEDLDYSAAPSSDEEFSGADGWRLVAQRRRITRRRTTHEHVESQERALSPLPLELSPIAERHLSTATGAPGMMRSRTLPSWKDHAGGNGEVNGGGSLAEDEGRRGKVLRKQRRLSAQPEE